VTVSRSRDGTTALARNARQNISFGARLHLDIVCSTRYWDFPCLQGNMGTEGHWPRRGSGWWGRGLCDIRPLSRVRTPRGGDCPAGQVILTRAFCACLVFAALYLLERTCSGFCWPVRVAIVHLPASAFLILLPSSDSGEPMHAFHGFSGHIRQPHCGTPSIAMQRP
jgi:hypothetical protein